MGWEVARYRARVVQDDGFVRIESDRTRTLPGVWDFALTQGDDVTLRFRWYDAAENPKNVSAWSFTLTGRTDVNASGTLFTSTGSVGAAPNYEISFALSASTTGALTFTRGVADLQGTDGSGNKRTLVRGSVGLVKGIT